MSDAAAQYGDSFAEVYDDWYVDMFDTDGAVRALSALAGDHPGPIVELGVGTGRLAIPLAARHEVIGIDASSAMLDRLHDKNPPAALTTILGDMADAADLLGGVRVALVFCAFNTFLNLTTEEAQQRCMHQVASVLADALFVVESFVPTTDPDVVAESVDAAAVRSDVPVLARTRVDAARQRIDGVHEEQRDGVTIERPWSVRYLTVEQFDALAGLAGLALVDRWSSWRGAPFDESSTAHISIYARIRSDR